MDIVTTLIVDDHPIVRQGIAQVIRQEKLASLVLEASNLQSALQLFSAHRPELVIVDLALGDEDGRNVIRSIRALNKETHILVLSMHDERDNAEDCLRDGADGYVMKQVATEQLADAIRRLQRGEIALSSVMQSAIFRGRKDAMSEGTRTVASLSDKEREILRLLGQGMSSSQIAETLHRSVKTIEAHRATLRGKLGLKTAVELIRFAALWSKQR
ncbi:DNA-binding response regulator [Ahniella affigens]|uniref:DNA-binding response regulator n=1 Tax=Ahniella affigens TaxID=2021234 RepID=A0A2P1PQL2_9GAMM|nr:DNA-binding response regulator [Ahniella affigens]